MATGQKGDIGTVEARGRRGGALTNARENQIPRWSVRIEGKSIDTKAVTWVAERTAYDVTEEAGESLLAGPGFDELRGSHEVRTMAQATLDVLNGLARLEFADHTPVKLHGTIYQDRADGSRDTVMYAETGRFGVRGYPATLETTGKDGQPLTSEPDPKDQRFSKVDQTRR